MKFKGYDELNEHIKLYSFNNIEDEKFNGQYALSNEFVRLPKKIELLPLKIMGLVLSKINYKKNYNSMDIINVECTLKEIRKVLGLENTNKNYEYYKDLVSNLPYMTNVSGYIGNKFVSSSVIPYVSISTDNEQIKFDFKLFGEFVPYYQNLTNNYTIIQLENTKKFKSRFSYYLYMNLLSWKEKNEIVAYRFYTTKQIKELFGLEKDDYCKSNGKFDRYNFEKKTIELACNEINEYTNMKVLWTKHNLPNSNRISHYCFEFVIKE